MNVFVFSFFTREIVHFLIVEYFLFWIVENIIIIYVTNLLIEKNFMTIYFIEFKLKN